MGFNNNNNNSYNYNQPNSPENFVRYDPPRPKKIYQITCRDCMKTFDWAEDPALSLHLCENCFYILVFKSITDRETFFNAAKQDPETILLNQFQADEWEKYMDDKEKPVLDRRTKAVLTCAWRLLNPALVSGKYWRKLAEVRVLANLDMYNFTASQLATPAPPVITAELMRFLGLDQNLAPKYLDMAKGQAS